MYKRKAETLRCDTPVIMGLEDIAPKEHLAGLKMNFKQVSLGFLKKDVHLS